MLLNVSYISEWVNFVILAGILYIFLIKPFVKLLQTRSRVISSKVGEADKKKNDSLARLHEYEKKAKNFQDEISALKEDLRQEGELERDIIIRKSDYMVEKTREETKLMMDRMLKHASENIRRFAIKRSTEKAGQIIKQKITKEDQERLVLNYLKRLAAKNLGDAKGESLL